jgi:hypothetical protein
LTRRKFVYPISVFLMVFLALALSSGCGCGDNESGGPTISSVTPNSGAPGDEVKIAGDNFGSSQGTGIVNVGEKSSGVVSWSSEQITIKVPSGLKEGSHGITVLTDSVESNEMSFTVTSAQSEHQERKQGEVEHPTPKSAILDYMKKHGMDSAGYTFSVYKTSKEDPNWKIDIASRTGQSPIYFVLHKVSGSWTVVDHGNAFTAAELQADGLPSDLIGQVPAPPPAPETQAQAVWNYIRNSGRDPSGVVVSITRESPSNGAWELGTAQQQGQQVNLVVFLEDQNKNWTVKAYGPTIPLSTISGLGAPADLAPTEQLILDFIKTEEQTSEAGGWSLSLSKVSRQNPDWEVVTGTKTGEGTMYFVVHWENGNWVVRDYGGDLKPSAVPGEPSDIP